MSLSLNFWTDILQVRQNLSTSQLDQVDIPATTSATFVVSFSMFSAFPFAVMWYMIGAINASLMLEVSYAELTFSEPPGRMQRLYLLLNLLFCLHWIMHVPSLKYTLIRQGKGCNQEDWSINTHFKYLWKSFIQAWVPPTSHIQHKWLWLVCSTCIGL